MSFRPRRISRSATFLAARASLAATALAALLAQPTAAATIGLAPSVQSVEAGETVSVDIVIGDLGGEVVSAYDLDLLYDSSLLTASDVVFTPALGDELFFEVFDDFDLSSPGVVDFAQLSLLFDDDLFALQGGDSVGVATVYFEAIAPGTSSLDFVLDPVNDVKGRGAQVLPIQSIAGSITVRGSGAVIPEPSAALVFCLGLLICGSRLSPGRAC